MMISYSSEQISTAEVAERAGIHKDTLLRWLRRGLVPEPSRDRRGWRYFSSAETAAVVALARRTSDVESPVYVETLPAGFAALKAIDWDFTNAKTNYLTHGIHPYPAKFIPQIPNALIQELSSVGDTVGDIFCGSGTTIVEALTLKRNAVGIDANPLACLIARSKTGIINEDDIAVLSEVSQVSRQLSDSIFAATDANDMFSSQIFRSDGWRPGSPRHDFWFEAHVTEELAEALSYCRAIKASKARDLALTAFSSIVVAVSRQDSDTRYVRREKNIPPGETLRRFARAVDQVTHAASELSELVEERFKCDVIAQDLLSNPKTPLMDLMVCSPPYPNAYSYHLYHRTRMNWLGMDQPRFKREEIGSHRKYSSNSKNGSTVETFRSEFTAILSWLSGNLKRGGYACFVVGDSTLKGQRIDNASLISEAGITAGFREVARIDRTMQSTKKAFNPAHGKIKTEQILILENVGEAS
ncbi:DNA methyltransferase [Corticimicrobacter sp.]|uniref:DNA methyltransferase n=1 Tax=Corticimicrobacter sp. TaxID=2678536 RepID=UPI0032DAA3DC